MATDSSKAGSNGRRPAADGAGDAGVPAHRTVSLLDELGMGQEVTVQAGLLADLAERRDQHDLAAQWRTFVAGRTGGLARHDVLLRAATRNREGLEARKRGDLNRALAAHLEALTGYEQAGASGAIAFTRSCLGFLATQMQDSAGALAHHAAGLKAAAKAGEAGSLALAVEGTAAGLDDGQAKWTALLLGAANTLWDASADEGEAIHRDDVAAVAERARSVLGDAVFAAAYERGALLGAADALATARSVVRDITSVPHQPAPST